MRGFAARWRKSAGLLVLLFVIGCTGSGDVEDGYLESGEESGGRIGASNHEVDGGKANWSEGIGVWLSENGRQGVEFFRELSGKAEKEWLAGLRTRYTPPGREPGAASDLPDLSDAGGQARWGLPEPEQQERTIFANRDLALAYAYNAVRQDEFDLGALTVEKLVEGFDFSQAPGTVSLIVVKDAAYAYLLDNATSRILSAAPVGMGALQSNRRDYFSTGCGVHIFTHWVTDVDHSIYGRGVLVFTDNDYLDPGYTFIGLHGTTNERALLISAKPSDRYITHGCIRNLEEYLMPLVSMFKSGDLQLMIVAPLSQPTGRMTQNFYTIPRYSSSFGRRGHTDGPTLQDIIDILNQRWSVKRKYLA